MKSDITYAPLYIHSFHVISPNRLLNSRQILSQYSCYEEIDNIPDRLRWCRYQLGLKQKEIAEIIGVSRIAYVSMESGSVDYYDPAVIDKLAEFFHIPPVDLLDEYNAFLYSGQGEQLRSIREQLGMTKKAFAQYIGIDPNRICCWEAEKKRISKSSWKKYFKSQI